MCCLCSKYVDVFLSFFSLLKRLIKIAYSFFIGTFLYNNCNLSKDKFRIVYFFPQVGHDWGYFTMITDLPKYFSDVLKFNIKETGLMSALPYMAMYVCSFIFASFCDFCIRKKWHSIGMGRKIYTTICEYKIIYCV